MVLEIVTLEIVLLEFVVLEMALPPSCAVALLAEHQGAGTKHRSEFHGGPHARSPFINHQARSCRQLRDFMKACEQR